MTENEDLSGRLDRTERRLQRLRRWVIVLGVGLAAVAAAVFIPGVHGALVAIFWIAGITLVTVGFIGGTMWLLDGVERAVSQQKPGSRAAET